MNNRLFVGNLSYDTNEEDLRGAFTPYGVTDVALPTDRNTGRPRGFAFVTIDGSQMTEAIRAWDGKDLQGRTLTVNEAKPREESGGGARRGGNGGGGRW